MIPFRLMPVTAEEPDELELTVPAELRYVRVLRLTTAGGLSLHDLDVEFVEEVRSAVGEAAALVLGEHGAPGTLRLRVRCDPDLVAVELQGVFEHRPDRAADEDELSRLIMTPLVDQVVVNLGESRVAFEKHR